MVEVGLDWGIEEIVIPSEVFGSPGMVESSLMTLEFLRNCCDGFDLKHITDLGSKVDLCSSRRLALPP